MESCELPMRDLPGHRAGFIPGVPGVPLTIRIYAAVLAAGGLLAALLCGGGAIALAATTPFIDPEEPRLLFAGSAACWSGIGLFVYRLGLGLSRGEKQAVYGICAVVLEALGWAVASFLSVWPFQLLLAGLVVVVFGPLALLALAHRGSFGQTQREGRCERPSPDSEP